MIGNRKLQIAIAITYGKHKHENHLWIMTGRMSKISSACAVLFICVGLIC